MTAPEPRAYDKAMGNEIQLYRDATLFYLDRERELEAKVQKLTAEKQQGQAHSKALARENAMLREENGGLREVLRQAQLQVEKLQSAVSLWRGVVDKRIEDWSDDQIKAMDSKLEITLLRRADRRLEEALARLRRG